VEKPAQASVDHDIAMTKKTSEKNALPRAFISDPVGGMIFLTSSTL
jgi:hypothetical protein